MSDLLLLLSLVVFHEERGQPKQCQYAALEVVYNRSEHPDFPSNPKAVIRQPSQFSWTRNLSNLKKPTYELDTWSESVRVAKDFLSNRTNYTKGAIYFNARHMGVRYRTPDNKGKPLLTCGKHVYF